jgi:hypothetical protein
MLDLYGQAAEAESKRDYMNAEKVPFQRPYVLLEFGLCWEHRLNMELDLQSLFGLLCTAVPEFIDPVFAKICPKR